MTNEISEVYGIFECNHCHKFFTTDYSLQRHITKRHDQTTRSEKVVVPCYSEESFVFKNADEEALTCDICGFICIGEASFYKHMFLHSNLTSEDGYTYIESPVTSGTQPGGLNRSSVSVNTTQSFTQHVDNELPVNSRTRFGEKSPVNYGTQPDDLNHPNGIVIDHASDDPNDGNGIEIGDSFDDPNDDNGIKISQVSNDVNDDNGIEKGQVSNDVNDDNVIEIGQVSNDVNDDNGIEIGQVSVELNNLNGIEIDHASDNFICDAISHTTYNSYQPNINIHTIDKYDHAADDSNKDDHIDISKFPVKVMTKYITDACDTYTIEVSPNLNGVGCTRDPVPNDSVKCNSTNNRKNRNRKKRKLNQLKPYDKTKISSIDVKIQHVDDNEISEPKIDVSQKSNDKGQFRNKTQHKCHVCDKVFTHIPHLRSHILIHTGEACTKCKICGKYLNACNMSTHMKRHRGILEKNFKCQFCGKCFVTDYYLQIHKRIHTGEKPFECSVCKRRFIRKDSVKVHICMTHRQKREQSIKETSKLSEDTSRCDICRITFNSSRSFNAHYRTTHLSEKLTKEFNDKKPFQCDLCDNKFTSKGNLKSHLLTHLGREAFPYKCDVCFQKFAHPSNVTSHMRTHTNDRPFKCEVCELSFKRGTHLRYHMRIHNGEFSKCPKCAKTFSQPRYLKAHLQQVHGLITNKDSNCVKHTASIKLKKSFKCEICGKEITRRSRLNDHMRLHTGDTAFKCDNCDEGFVSTYYLNKHYKQYPEHQIKTL